MLRRVFVCGAVVGCSMSLLLYTLVVTLPPQMRLGGVVDRAMVALWPTALGLMAVQSPAKTLFAVTVFAVAVLSNGVLYGLIAVGVWLAVRRLGLV